MKICFPLVGHTKNSADGAFGCVKRSLREDDAVVPEDMMGVIKTSSSSARCIPGVDVDWRKWKDLLGDAFRMPASCHIKGFHVFEFDASDPGYMTMRKRTTSTEAQRVSLLGKDGLANFRSIHWDDVLRDPVYTGLIPDLEKQESKKQKNRAEYLKINILDRYYVGNERIRQKYFEDGSSHTTSTADS